MPRYSYKCRECNYVSEFFRKIEYRDILIACENCGQAAERIMDLPQPAVIRFRPGYFDTIGDHADTEMEFNNKYSKAVDKYVNETYDTGRIK